MNGGPGLHVRKPPRPTFSQPVLTPEPSICLLQRRSQG